MLIVTDGSMGSWDPDVDRTELVQRRKAEQRAAASVLGASDLIFFDLPDGELVYDSDLRTSVADVIRAVRPDVVLGHDPWQRYQLHPDHRATGLATVDGVVSAREPLAHSLSGHPHHRPNAILLWSADTPDHVEPASEATFQRKIDALLCHSSQAVTTMGDATASDHAREEFETRMRRWMADGSIPHGIELGETFKRLIP